MPHLLSEQDKLNFIDCKLNKNNDRVTLYRKKFQKVILSIF